MNIDYHTRLSNYELLRLVAMAMVLVTHWIFVAVVPPTHEDMSLNPMFSITRIVIESLVLVCVNVFVLISGYFGIRSSHHSVFNYAFMVIFWYVVISIATLVFNREMSFGSIFTNMLPGAGEWFVVVYTLMLLFAPMVNKFMDGLDRKAAIRIILIFYILQTVFGWAVPAKPWNIAFVGGYSLPSLLGLYMLGRCLALHPLPRKYCCRSLLISVYLICSVINSIFFISIITLCDNTDINIMACNRFMSYASPIIVLQSVALFMLFGTLKFHSNIINRLAISAFSVYVIHCNPNIFPFFCTIGANCAASYSGLIYIGISTAILITVFFFCMALDQVRACIWLNISRRQTR